MNVFRNTVLFLLAMVAIASTAPTTRGITGLFWTNTADTLPQWRYHFSLSSELAYLTVQAGDASEENALQLRQLTHAFSFGYGFTRWLELGVSVPFTQVSTNQPLRNQRAYIWNDALNGNSFSGVGDPTIALKLRFYQNPEHRITIGASLEGKVGLAESEKAPRGTGQTDVAMRFNFSKYWSRHSLHLNVGYGFPGVPNYGTRHDHAVNIHNVFTVNMGYAACITPRLKFITELEGRNVFYDHAPEWKESFAPLCGLVGLRYFFVPTEQRDSNFFKPVWSLGFATTWDFNDPKPAPGYVMQIALSPRTGADRCRFIPPAQRAVNYGPSVVAQVDPMVFDLNANQVDGDTLNEPMHGRIWALVSDLENDPVTLRWTVTVDDAPSFDITTDRNFVFTYEYCNTHTFTVIATDTNGNKGQDTVTVTFNIREAATTPEVVATPSQPERRVVYLLPILFWFDRWNIERKYEAQLIELAHTMDKFPELTLELVGYACQWGTDEYNELLGDDRAREVYNRLKSLGVKPSHMRHISRGENDPIVPCPTGDCDKDALAVNRRVEIHVLSGAPEHVSFETLQPAARK